MKSQPVAITDSDLPGSAGEEILEAAGLAVRRADCATADDVIRAGQGADALIVQWATVSEHALADLSGLRFISRQPCLCQRATTSLTAADPKACCPEEVVE